jgi:hypothetical protein
MMGYINNYFMNGKNRAEEEEIIQQEELADKAKESLVDKLREKVQSKVNESLIPNKNYESTVGVYGGKMTEDENGKMVYDTRGAISKVDKFGDALLRTYDEHTVKEPGRLARKHPKQASKFLTMPGTKRYRGSREEIVENAERLGLGEYYGLDENGVEIKNPKIYKEGTILQDVYRSVEINSDKLNNVDRFQALAEASKYVKGIHQEHGGIGELLVSDIIFRRNEDGKVSDPVLNLPDIVFNKEKKTGENEKKATDLLDFLASVYFEEFKRSQDWDDARKSLETVLENYGDEEIIHLTKSLAKRGRLTLQGNVESLNLPETVTKKGIKLFSLHNNARLSPKKGFDGQMRTDIIDACEKFAK